MGIYVDGTEEMKEDAIEKIEDYVTACLDNEDTETILNKIRETDLYSLEEEKIKKIKQQLLRVVSIPNLEDKIKKAVINLSKIGQVKVINKSLSNQRRLDLIYNLMNNIEIFKTQTRELKRNTGNYNNNYEYILNYLLTAQELLKTIYEYSEEYEEVKKQIVQQTVEENNLKLLVFNR